MDKSVSTILYGGTFDPPHEGHRHCLAAARRRFPEDRLVVLVSPVPPQAGLGVKSPEADVSHRIQMSRLAFLRPELQPCEVSDFEISLSEPHYTVKTLRAFVAAYPGKLRFLMGMDQFQSFSRWREPLEILRLADLVVVDRSDEGHRFGLISEQLIEHLGLDGACHGSSVSLKGLGSIFFIEEVCVDISSSEIRMGLSDQCASQIDQDVLAYIRKHKLYREVS